MHKLLVDRHNASPVNKRLFYKDSIMKKHLQLLSAIFCWLILSSYNTLVFAQPENSVMTPTAQYRFFYTINGESGKIVKQEDGTFQLIVQSVRPVVSSHSRVPQKKSSTLPLGKLIDGWVQNDQSGTPKALYVDLTATQFDSKTATTKQFYQKVILSKPYYVKERGEFVANLGFANAGVTVNPLEKIDNVVLSIDGCQLCDCDDNQVECDF